MLKVRQVKNVVVSLDYADCPDDGGKYQLLCLNHGYLIQSNNKNILWRHADDVMNWCAACAGEDHRYPETFKGIK